jgi:hypothetical protein
MNQQQYTQFLLAQRSLEEIKYMRDHPVQFSTGTCTLWGINERQRVEAVLTVISVLEKSNG